MSQWDGQVETGTSRNTFVVYHTGVSCETSSTVLKFLQTIQHVQMFRSNLSIPSHNYYAQLIVPWEFLIPFSTIDGPIEKKQLSKLRIAGRALGSLELTDILKKNLIANRQEN